MATTIDIDLSCDRLIAIASDMVDNHNYIGALKMLNKNADRHGNEEDALMLYAEIFDDMGLFEKCINGWFRYMDVTDSQDMSDCYEGLAINFMNVGNEKISAYYYNKLLNECDGINLSAWEEIVKDFLQTDENPLKFVYPPSIADCTPVMSAGVEKMREGDFEGACREFEKIDELNPGYSSARNYIAMCKIISDKTDEAEKECLKILEKHPHDIQALTTLAAVKTEAGDEEEARALAEKLLTIDIDDADEIYKIATVCCENRMHEQAYKLFCKLPAEYNYDLNVTYFKAVSAFNCGKYDESFDAFDRIATIYPEAVTARFYYNAAREMYKNGESAELSYFYRMPQAIRESSLKMLAAYMRLSQANAKKLSSELNLTSCIRWCFDESDGRHGEELRALATQVAVKSGDDDCVREILLDAFVSDKLKLDALSSLAERNRFDCFGIVVYNIYRRVTTQALSLGRSRKKNFIAAYAWLVAHFSILDDEYGKAFAAAAQDLYVELAESRRLDAAKDAEALTAAVYMLSGVKDAGVDSDHITEFFGVSNERIQKITGKI